MTPAIARGSVISRLIRKDYQLDRSVILLCLLGATIAVGVVQIGGATAFVIGFGSLFLAMVMCAAMMPILSIVNERKKQTLPFIMSLPVSPMQYTTAKLVANVGMFLVAWLLMLGGALYVVFVRHLLPAGGVASILIYSLLPFVGFSVVTATAMVGESEGWGIAANAVVNSTYWLWWYLISSQVPEVNSDWKSSVVIWRPVALKIIGGELAAIVLLLAATYYLQSRKRDFI